ncbi:MAG: hypothetical protein LBQ68_05580 [Clostridiales bacterium]|jgi:ATP-binding cassette subfamily B protein|nr:hypothetical protein [Clostridiales bacterium]
MDEGTSNLDFVSENHIYSIIMRQKMTAIFIAHRLSTIRNCDEIIVLHQGQVAERDTHENLLAKKGQYYKLWLSQIGIDLPIDKESASDKKKNVIDTNKEEMNYER